MLPFPHCRQSLLLRPYRAMRAAKETCLRCSSPSCEYSAASALQVPVSPETGGRTGCLSPAPVADRCRFVARSSGLELSGPASICSSSCSQTNREKVAAEICTAEGAVCYI